MLLEAPFDPIRRQMNSVLLTIDLTKAVADEAIERKDCVVVSYRTRLNTREIEVLISADWKCRSYHIQRLQVSYSRRLSATVAS